MAAATANLAKDQVNEAEKSLLDKEAEPEPVISSKEKTESLIPKKEITDQPQEKSSFWQKHKTKIIAVIIILLILLILGLINRNKKLEQEKEFEKLPPEEKEMIFERVPEIKKDLSRALINRDPDLIFGLLDELNIIAEKAPPELKKQIAIEINNTLKNPDLPPELKQELKQLQRKLK